MFRSSNKINKRPKFYSVKSNFELRFLIKIVPIYQVNKFFLVLYYYMRSVDRKELEHERVEYWNKKENQKKFFEESFFKFSVKCFVFFLLWYSI